MSRRFLFQGSGYSESSNSSYKHYIIDRNIRLSRVPTEISLLSYKKTQERRKEKTELHSRRLIKSLEHSNLPMSSKVRNNFVVKFTHYVIQKFVDQALSYCDNYILASSEVVVLERIKWHHRFFKEGRETPAKTDSVLHFDVVHCISVHSGSSRTNYSVLISQSPSNLQNASCSCHFSHLNRIPCQHITRVAIAYSEETVRNPRIRRILGPRIAIDIFFHDYCKTDGSEVTSYFIAGFKKQIINHPQIIYNQRKRTKLSNHIVRKPSRRMN